MAERLRCSRGEIGSSAVGVGGGGGGKFLIRAVRSKLLRLGGAAEEAKDRLEDRGDHDWEVVIRLATLITDCLGN